MVGFNGTVSHQIDEKFRVRIPSKFWPKGEENEEDKSGKEFYFMAGPQGCIRVYRKEALDERLNRMREVPSNSLDKMNAKRKILGSIESVETDKQGRVVIPANLRAYAKITRDLISVGMDDHFEIWAKDEYERMDLNMSFERAYLEVGFF